MPADIPPSPASTVGVPGTNSAPIVLVSSVGEAEAKATPSASLTLAADIPALVAALQLTSPALAAKLTTSVHSAPWGGLVVAAVGWAVAKWGLGWDDGTQAAVAGVLTLVGGYAVQWVQGRLALASAVNTAAKPQQ